MVFNQSNPINSKKKIKPLSLEKAFNIAFFEKDLFENFLSLNPLEHITESYYDGRLVHEPSVKLKEYLKFINSFIFSYLSVNEDVVFSYRKGSSVFEAVEKHSKNIVFYNTDITNFFPSIDRNFAREILESNHTNIPISDIKDYTEIILDFIIINNSLPVGFSTSPSFSNACLYEFDNLLKFYCEDKGFIYTRYSDDIIISSNSVNDFDNTINVVPQLINDTYDGRFNLNIHKTKLVKRGSKIKLLGMVILPSGKVSVDIKVKLRVEHLIHYYITDKVKFISSVKNDKKIKTKNIDEADIEGRGVSALSGLLNYINTIDKTYLDKLRKKFGNTIVDMLLYKNVN